MKSFLLLVSFFLVGFVLTQDVRVPENLLEITTVHQNASDVEYDETVEEVTEDTPAPDSLIDTRTPNIVSPIHPNYPQDRRPPCDQQAPPYYPPLSQQRPCDVVEPSRPGYYPPEEIQTITPIIDTRYDPAVKEENSVCPIGSVQNGSVCVEVYSNDCPQGYTWKNDRCVLSRTSCPLNFEWDGRSCVQRRICPINHVWKNERCVLPIPECPIGWHWNGDICQVDNIQCPPGSVVLGNECVDESFTCPPGFFEENDECVKPRPICPPGYLLNLSSGFCVQENFRCPPGSQQINGDCKTIVVRCPPGTYKVRNQCYNLTTPRYPDLQPGTPTPRPIVTIPTKRPTKPLTCPEGFVLYNNLCYRCPQSYNLCNSQCVRHTDCDDVSPPGYPQFPWKTPSQPVININLYSRDFSSSRPSYDGRHVINNIEPINNTIVNINNVTHPVTLNNVNENNFYIYTDTQCADGSIRTVVIKNNETINGCVDINPDRHPDRDSIQDKSTETEHDDNENEQEKCCEIVTARQCKKKNEDHWKCSHKRYKYCGKFCIADRLYLKPPSTSYNNNVLTIAPSHPGHASPPCFGRDCPAFGLL